MPTAQRLFAEFDLYQSPRPVQGVETRTQGTPAPTLGLQTEPIMNDIDLRDLVIEELEFNPDINGASISQP